MGLFEFKDKGNMTREEIDFLIDFLIARKEEGRPLPGLLGDLRAVRDPHGERRGGAREHVVARGHRHQGRGSPLRLRLPEGRHAGLARRPARSRPGSAARPSTKPTSTSTGGSTGWPGAFVARQGYYMSVPENVKKPPRAGRVGLLVRRASPPRRSCPTPSAPSSWSRARSATAARTGTASATSRYGTRSWTRTTTS